MTNYIAVAQPQFTEHNVYRVSPPIKCFDYICIETYQEEGYAYDDGTDNMFFYTVLYSFVPTPDYAISGYWEPIRDRIDWFYEWHGSDAEFLAQFGIEVVSDYVEF